jgi:uncharacterized damage-inducible protein DinB
MTQQVATETRVDGRTMAHVLTLPGCFCRGASVEKALQCIPPEIQRFLSWLDSKGLHPENASTSWQVVEQQEGVAPFESGDAATLFQLDLLPPEDEEVEATLRVAEVTRQDLLALARSLSLEELQKPRSTGIRTIERILWHIAHAEEWYVSRLGVIPALHRFDDFPGTLWEYLTAVREMAVERFRGMASLERATVFRIPEFTDHPDEPWTLRKALRRMIEHEREHTGNIQRLLAESEMGED